jgi:hypothetical protein
MADTYVYLSDFIMPEFTEIDLLQRLAYLRACAFAASDMASIFE